jgi:hypothetical protein
MGNDRTQQGAQSRAPEWEAQALPHAVMDIKTLRD